MVDEFSAPAGGRSWSVTGSLEQVESFGTEHAIAIWPPTTSPTRSMKGPPGTGRPPAHHPPATGDRRRLLSMCVATEFKSNAKEIKKRLAWRREYIQFRYFVWPYRNDRTTVPLTSILLSWVWTRTTKQISSNVVPCSNISLNQPAGWPWSSRRTGDVAGGWGQWERAASYATRRHSPHGTTTTKKL